MLCIKCGSELQEGKAFCADCGEKQENKLFKATYCLYCDSRLNEGAMSCDNCGEKQEVKPEVITQEPKVSAKKKWRAPLIIGVAVITMIVLLSIPGRETDLERQLREAQDASRRWDIAANSSCCTTAEHKSAFRTFFAGHRGTIGYDDLKPFFDRHPRLANDTAFIQWVEDNYIRR